MCSIAGIFIREYPPCDRIVANFLAYGELRGTDGFGYYVAETEEPFREMFHGSTEIPSSYPNLIKEFSFDPEDPAGYPRTAMSQGDLLLTNHRAAPETEGSEGTQPVVIQKPNGRSVVVTHNGSVSQFIIEELKELGYKFTTSIDSEAIIHAIDYFKWDIKAAMEYLSGGFAFILYDAEFKRLYSVCTHNPLYVGYAKGYGMVWHSIEEAVSGFISECRRIPTEKTGICMWEDYYWDLHKENTIVTYDLDSGMMTEEKFEPRYMHPKFNTFTYANKNRVKTLVAASGGLDSTTTLATLKAANMNPEAVHFKYGHRGEECELMARETVTRKLDIPLITFDISESMKMLDKGGMLTGENERVYTGTAESLKTTAAWTCFRNGFFATYMGALAESYIVKHLCDSVYLTGGFLQLTESGSYPDNSERFMSSFIKFAQFASIVGNRIKPLYSLCNLLKAEQFLLLEYLGLLDELEPHLISCDRPKVVTLPDVCLLNGDQDPDAKIYPHLCWDVAANAAIMTPEGKIEPASGSGRLSMWGHYRAFGNTRLSKRRYYIVKDENYIPYQIKDEIKPIKTTSKKILSKIQIPYENLVELQYAITKAEKR